jgi:SAM-dependent methyltransferase
MSKIARYFNLVRTRGLSESLRIFRERGLERWYEWRFGVRTRADRVPGHAEMIDPDGYGYVASDYPTLFHILKQVKKDVRAPVLLDYGCGKGRVLVAAAALGYGRVIGVEIDAGLARDAEANLRAATAAVGPFSWEVAHLPGDRFTVPDDVNVAFFCNPFAGEVLARVLDEIRASWLRKPRRIVLVCRLPEDCQFEREIAVIGWLEEIRHVVYRPELRYRLYRTEAS